MPARSARRSVRAKPAARASSSTAIAWPAPTSSGEQAGAALGGRATSRRTTSRPSRPGEAARRRARGADLGRQLRAVLDVGRVGRRRRRRRRRRRAGRRARSATSSPSRAALARATSSASVADVGAVTTRSGRSSLSASATAPLPVPTSTTRAPCGSVERRLDERLGLRARDEHARVDLQVEVAKALDAGDVGDRLAPDRSAGARRPGRCGPPGPRPARRRRPASRRRVDRPARGRAAPRRRGAACRRRPRRARSPPSRAPRAPACRPSALS